MVIFHPVPACTSRHPGGRACQWLPANSCQGQADRVTAACATAAWSGWTDHQGTELPEGRYTNMEGEGFLS